jgi:ferredoxin, 2Fe-2S
MPVVRFVLPGEEVRCVEVPAGTTLLEAARLHDIAIEGACGGAMACATCHIHVEEGWFDRLPSARPEEADMLDFAQSLAPTSRLGCQIRVGPAEDGIVVRVPRTTLLED